MSRIRIEYQRLPSMKSAKRNPKLHDLPEIVASLERFGQADVAAVVNEKNGRMVAGHGRIEALTFMHERGDKPPKGIDTDDDGTWLVPVLRGVSFKNTREAEAYLVAVNRLVERGGWDSDGLGALLSDLRDHDALAGVGYSEKDVDALLASVEPTHVDPPEQFESVTGNVSTAYQCPKCGYEWNGLPKGST